MFPLQQRKHLKFFMGGKYHLEMLLLGTKRFKLQLEELHPRLRLLLFKIFLVKSSEGIYIA